MYNPQEIALKIKETAKVKKISIKQLLEKCDLNINYISELAKGKQASALNISKIADCLEVSTDYLLGRTTEKNISANYGIQNHSDNNQGDITNQLNLQGENGLHGKMLGEFDKLDFKDQVKVLNLIAELSNKEGG